MTESISQSFLEKAKAAIEKIKYPRLVTIGAAVLLIGGGVAAYLAVVQKSPPGNVPAGANLVPQDAFAVLSLSTERGRWQKLREFGTVESLALFDAQLKQLNANFLAANGLDYEKDIQPWLGGEVTIAFLPAHAGASASTTAPNTTTAPAGKESVVLVLPIDNLSRAKQLLEKVKPPKQGKWVDRTYKEVKIRETQGSAESNYSLALLADRFLIVTTNPKATDLAIDTYKGAPSLATTPGYSEALSQIENPESFGRIYLNVPSTMALATVHSVRPLSPQPKAPPLQQQGFATNVILEPEGLRFQGVSWLKPDSPKKQAVENKAHNMLTRLPADTLMMVSGNNLQRFWKEYAEGAEANPLTPLSPQWLSSGVASNTGMDWEKDYMAWMSGEFSLALIPAIAGTSTQFPFSLTLMVQSNNRGLAEKTFKQLDRVMNSRYRYKVEETKIADRPLVNWTSEYGGVTLSHGWLDGNVAFLTLGAPVAGAIAPKPQTALALSSQFQKAVPSQLESTSGNFFIDVDRLLNSKQYSLPSLPPVPQTIASAIRTVGVTAATVSDRTTLYNVLVALKKETQPVTKPSPAKPASPTQSPPAISPKQQATPSARPTPAPQNSSPKPQATSAPTAIPAPSASPTAPLAPIASPTAPLAPPATPVAPAPSASPTAPLAPPATPVTPAPSASPTAAAPSAPASAPSPQPSPTQVPTPVPAPSP